MDTVSGIQEWKIELKRKVKSLCWQGDRLVDWAGGGTAYDVDGNIYERHVNYAYRFDAAVVSPSGEFAVIYEKLGTKGLILKQGKILREINRSFYHANAYEYPVVLFKLADGRDVIAHCPDHYNQIEIEEVETGKRLTTNRESKGAMFHSRLTVNASNTNLLSAGWVWQPVDIIGIYDIKTALTNSASLDGRGIASFELDYVDSVSFLDDDTLVVTSSFEKIEEISDEEELRFDEPAFVGLYSIGRHKFSSKLIPETIIGTVLPLNSHLIIGFCEHPKLISLDTGKVLHRWPELNSGKQHSSVIWHIDMPPPLALDPTNHRFALADKTSITVIQVDPTAFLQNIKPDQKET